MAGEASVVLLDTPARTRYEIRRTAGEAALVSIQVEDEVSASQVLEVTNGDLRELRGFVEELAREWRGWDVPKVWKLRDERTSLEARHDGYGHITLAARLFPYDYHDDWRVEATLIYEAGQLD